MRRFPVLLASSILCALLSVGCKQGVGERCEQDSDCASGYCSAANGVRNQTAKCQPTRDIVIPDAASPVDATPADRATSEAGGDASDANTSPDVSVDTGVDTSPAEVATDADGSTGG